MDHAAQQAWKYLKFTKSRAIPFSQLFSLNWAVIKLNVLRPQLYYENHQCFRAYWICLFRLIQLIFIPVILPFALILQLNYIMLPFSKPFTTLMMYQDSFGSLHCTQFKKINPVKPGRNVIHFSDNFRILLNNLWCTRFSNIHFSDVQF